jgi:hypothetical protein
MNRTTKTIISVLVILMLASTIVYAKDQIDINNRKAAPPDVIPQNADQIQTGTSAVDQLTYTDMWTYLSTQSFYSGSSSWSDVPGMTQKITIRYPSTLAVMFTSETGGDVNIRILLDGSELGPGTVGYDRYEIPGTLESHSFNFRREWVSTGTHTIKVQQKSGSKYGGTLYKSMIVLVNGYGH